MTEKAKEVARGSANSKKPHNMVATIEQHYQGPIPTAREFKGYEQVLPGAADRILKMSEDALKAEIRSGYIDRLGALISVVLNRGFLYALLVATVYLLINDKPVGAFLTGIAPIVASIYAVLRDSRKKR